MTTQGIKITGKDIGIIVMLAGMIITFFVKFEVMKTQVQNNTKTLEDNNLEVISYKLEELDKKMDKAIEILINQ